MSETIEEKLIRLSRYEEAAPAYYGTVYDLTAMIDELKVEIRLMRIEQSTA